MTFILTYFEAVWELIVEMAPYLLLGFAIAGLLHRYIREDWIQKRLGKQNFSSIITASLVGVPMPLCSCGVVPVAASIRNRGASKGATASFLTSTPQTGVDSIMATYGMMGGVFALYRVAVALISGVAIGLLINKTSKDDSRPLPRTQITNAESPHTWKNSIRYAFHDLPRDIGSNLIIGFLLAGLITAIAPEDILSNIPGGIFSSILLTTLLATPLYICSTGSIPLAIALIHSGLPVSAALVLLIAGPATNAATITTMKKVLGGKETALYVASIVFTSWIAAFVFHIFFSDSALNIIAHHAMGHFNTFEIACAIALIILLLANYLPKASTPIAMTENPNIHTASLTVKGMSCSHCQRSVEQGLGSLPDITAVTVDLAKEHVTVQGRTIEPASIVSKINALGFEAGEVTID